MFKWLKKLTRVNQNMECSPEDFQKASTHSIMPDIYQEKISALPVRPGDDEIIAQRNRQDFELSCSSCVTSSCGTCGVSFYKATSEDTNLDLDILSSKRKGMHKKLKL